MNDFRKILFFIAVCSSVIIQAVALDHNFEESENCIQRNITAEINPNCPDKCSNFTLVYVQERGCQDVLHHLWSMETVPVLFYAQTDLDAQLLIDWDKLLTGNGTQAINFSTKPQYFGALLITKFIVYNDLNDTGLIPSRDQENVIILDPAHMSWDLKSKNFSVNSSASVSFQLKSYNGQELDLSSNMEIILTAYGTRDRSPVLPHLAYTENSTQIDFIFDNVESLEPFSNLRFAVEMTSLVSELDSNFSLSVWRSLDDEYTPGVFKLMEVRSGMNEHWLQWRPVCYTSVKRDIGDSTGVSHSEIKNYVNRTNEALPNASLLQSILLKTEMQSVTVGAFNVSFGVESDGFYQASNYTAWTIVMGHGRPAEDRFSLMVILVMAIGLGFPVIVLLLGGLAIAIRNYKNSKDDLLLSD